MDRILEDLSRRAGHQSNMTGLNLARWDLKAVLQTHGFALSKDQPDE